MKARIPNPAKPHGPRAVTVATANPARRPAAAITDRAKRYRANRDIAAPSRHCHYCGRTPRQAGPLMVDHIDGNETHGNPENLTWSCRSCNTKKGGVFRRAGRGKPTRQYNSAKPAAGARSLGQWIQAVMAMRGESSTMSVPAAVALVQATPPARRSEFAAEIWARRRERGTDKREEIPF